MHSRVVARLSPSRVTLLQTDIVAGEFAPRHGNGHLTHMTRTSTAKIWWETIVEVLQK